jgi:D-arabinose 1-dehydrogenase-like Zn-dependent alcohol dehydrogenase
MTPTTMRAAVLPAPAQPVTVEEMPVPRPGAGEVLIRVEACGVCHTGLHVMKGDGSAILQVARAFGAAQAIASDVQADKLELACATGATDAVNATEADAVEAVRELSAGGVDVGGA